MHLQELIEEASDLDLLKEMLSFFVNRMMEPDVESLTGALYGERRIDRINQGNGSRERPWPGRGAGRFASGYGNLPSSPGRPMAKAHVSGPICRVALDPQLNFPNHLHYW